MKISPSYVRKMISKKKNLPGCSCKPSTRVNKKESIRAAKKKKSKNKIDKKKKPEYFPVFFYSASDSLLESRFVRSVLLRGCEL